MLTYLAATAREARERAGLRQLDIATTAGVAHTTVSRFELAQAWPMDPDAMIAAYAAETGVGARELWSSALSRW